MTLRVCQTEPQRHALLARVVAAGDGWFVPDRTILHAPDPAYRHAVPADRGEAIGGGHKTKIAKARLGREAGVIHHVRGPVPPPGTSIQLHLDVARREQWARAHALAHLLAAAVVARRGELAAFPETTGGQVRARVRLRGGAAEAADLLRDVNAKIREGGRPEVAHAARDDADRRVLPGTDLPPHDVVRLVAYHGAWLACDAPPARNLLDVGGARLAGAPREGRDGLQLSLRVG